MFIRILFYYPNLWENRDSILLKMGVQNASLYSPKHFYNVCKLCKLNPLKVTIRSYLMASRSGWRMFKPNHESILAVI